MDQEKKTNLPPVSFDEFEPTSFTKWKGETIVSLKGGDYDKKMYTPTYEGITLQPVYLKSDLDKVNAATSFPGEQEYLRGTRAGGYLEQPWAIAQGVHTACPKEANAELLHHLAKGGDAVNVKIGPGGVDVKTAEDMKVLLAGVDLTKTRLHITAPCAGEAIRLMEEAGIDLSKASGCIGCDPIGTLVATGKLPVSLDEAYDCIAKTIQHAAEAAPGIRTIVVDGLPYANGGANALQEVAYCMSTAETYIDAMIQRGVDVNAAAKAIRFSFSLGANFFMQIAKLRAARVVFAQMVKTFGGDAEARKIDTFVTTSPFTQTVVDPYVNVLRATTQAFSGVVGGADGMCVLPMDEALGGTEEASSRLARNIQVMLKEEFNLLQPVDPAGGSWYVETLTAQLGQAIWTKLGAIDAKGGIIAMLKSGAIQAEVDATLQQRFKNLETRADRAVGVNMYANMTEEKLTRKPSTAAPACDKPAVETIKPIEAHRWTERFEALRYATEDYEAKTGKKINVFLANMGDVHQHKARADFARGFLEVGHFNVIGNSGFPTVDEAVAAAVESGADVTVICSTDATYPELVPAIAKGIKAKCPDMIILVAGAPAKAYKQAYLDAGVNDFIHVKANCYEIISNIQKARGIC